MAFKNPWGKGSVQHDKWFSNHWIDNQGKKSDQEHKIVSKEIEATTDDKVLLPLFQQYPDPRWKVYIVKKGESFDSIAEKFQISADLTETPGETLAKKNNLDYYNKSIPKENDALALPDITDATLADIESRLDELAMTAEENGWAVALDNLKRFRDGVGGVKNLDVAWLKSFEEVQDAIQVIHGYFEDSCFNFYANSLKDGETKHGDGTKMGKGDKFWWETVTNPSYIDGRNELSYACGSSILRGIGIIDLLKSEDLLSVTGEVDFKFVDEYDWNEGDSVPVGYDPVRAILFGPFFMYEWIEDYEMILLQEFRGAKPFSIRASWKQKVDGTVNEDIFTPNEIEISWLDI